MSTKPRALDARAVLSERHQAAFWSKVDMDPDGCWIWQAALARNGYPVYGAQQPDGTVPQWKAHRLSWSLAYGPILEGILVCHRCDNPPCVRPDHLFLGTPSDNMQDMLRKGRGGYTGPHRPARGERSPHSKVSDDERREAVRAYYALEATQTELAWRYGVTAATVSKWVRSGRWEPESLMRDDVPA